MQLHGSFPPPAPLFADVSIGDYRNEDQAKTLVENANFLSVIHGVGPSRKIDYKGFGDKYFWQNKSISLAASSLLFITYIAFSFGTLLYLNKKYSSKGGILYIVQSIRDFILPLLYQG
ncbi:hypothetical protein [Roseibium sp.]|uniref:hypothetical protein n=1 Tax=Roseibium sp. TaxID=1936156 RepID=UPI003A9787F6